MHYSKSCSSTYKTIFINNSLYVESRFHFSENIFCQVKRMNDEKSRHKWVKAKELHVQENESKLITIFEFKRFMAHFDIVCASKQRAY